MIDRTALKTETGERLRAIRESRGISQYKLAELSGIHRVTIARIETGDHLPAWDILCTLADSLGVSVSEFRKN